VNRVALITGASRGIGRGIALELAGLGFDLALNYAGNLTAAEETATLCAARATAAGHSIRCLPIQADIGLVGDRQKLAGTTREAFGRIDLLVNNAGITSIGRSDLLDATEENFDRLMAVNLKGPYFLTQQIARWMIELAANPPADQPYRPKIITISSVSSYAVSVNRGDYCLAKAALGMLTQLFAARLAGAGILVYEIRPGIIETDMTSAVHAKYDHLIANGLTPIRRWGSPEDVGRAVAAIVSDQFPFSTGEVFNVDGGFHLRQL